MSNIEPIRKPNFKAKYRVKRHQKIAQTVRARLFRVNGKTYLYSGQPGTYAQIHSALKSLQQLHRNTLRMREVANLTTCDGLLTRDVITSVAKSLTKWEAWVTHHARLKSRTKNQELLQIEQLNHRLKYFSRSLSGQSETASPFLLTPEDETELSVLLTNFSRCSPQSSGIPVLTEFQTKLARVIYWFKGTNATSQFLETIGEGMALTSTSQLLLDKTLDWMEGLTAKLNSVPFWQVMDELFKSQRYEEAKEIATRLGTWKKIKKGQKPIVRIQAAMESLRKAGRTAAIFVNDLFPTEIAAWVMSQKYHDLQFPGRWAQDFIHDLDIGRFRDLVRFLSEREQSPALPKLLRWIKNTNCQETATLSESLFWLAQGTTESDLNFATTRLRNVGLDPEVKVRRVRKVIESYTSAFKIRDVLQTQQLDCWIRNNHSLHALEQLVGWLRRFPQRLLTMNVKAKLDAVLCDLEETRLLDRNYDGPYLNVIADWAKRWNPLNESFPDERNLPKELRSWLRRLGRYHKICGESPRLTKSISREITLPEKRRREFEELGRLLNDTPSQKLQDRYHYLQKNSSGDRIDIARTLRATQESCLHAGLDALRCLILKSADSIWKEKTSLPRLKHLTGSRRLSFSNWIDKMTFLELRLLKETISAWNRYGNQFKQHLNFNKSWLRVAKRRGVRIASWLNPSPENLSNPMGDYRIGVEADPVKIYSMGTIFGTCLNQGGCNEMSVLSNAAHANKQVVFVYDKNDKPVARQLIAINGQFELIGFHCYIAFDGKEKATRQMVLKAIAAYCGRLARAAGIRLGSDGEPTGLGNHFWYDDGSHPWDAVAVLAANGIESEDRVHGYTFTCAPESVAISISAQPYFGAADSTLNV